MNGAPASRMGRLAIDGLLLAVLGLTMAVLGPYRTIDIAAPLRSAYWLAAIVVGGLIGIAIDALLGAFLSRFWLRIAVVSLAMTPLVTVFVHALDIALLGDPPEWDRVLELAWRVFVVSFLVMALRGLIWRRVVETRTVVVPPLPEAERAFRQRLSAKRRGARLIAVEAEDHYVQVHTDAGPELIAMRFSEAVDELAAAYGFRLHRSWWVAGDAIESVRWRRGTGVATLAGGLVAPVSRNCAAALKQAGWR